LTTVSITLTDDKNGRIYVRSDMLCDTDIEENQTLVLAFQILANLNMKKVAGTLTSGCIVADNDASGTGERIAREIGWPYYMPPEVGHDFNDHHMAVGNFRAGQDLMQSLPMLMRGQ